VSTILSVNNQSSNQLLSPSMSATALQENVYLRSY